MPGAGILGNLELGSLCTYQSRFDYPLYFAFALYLLIKQSGVSKFSFDTTLSPSNKSIMTSRDTTDGGVEDGGNLLRLENVKKWAVREYCELIHSSSKAQRASFRKFDHTAYSNITINVHCASAVVGICLDHSVLGKTQVFITEMSMIKSWLKSSGIPATLLATLVANTAREKFMSWVKKFRWLGTGSSERLRYLIYMMSVEI